MQPINLLALGLLLILSACSPAEKTEEIPADLAAKKELLRTVRSEQRELNQRIKAIEDAIAEQDPDFAPKATLVTASTVAKSNFSNYAKLQGTVQAEEIATAGPEIPGRILNLHVSEGEDVIRRQLIATIDVENFRTQRTELETAAALAKTVYERQERLWEQNIGSELQYLEAKNNYERLQQNLASIDVQLAKRNIFAPITGTVQRVFLRAGENAMPGAPIVSIISTGKLKIVADAPEEFLTKVKRGQSVKVNVPTLGESFSAPISRIGKTVDPANRTFAVEIDVPRNKAGQLKTNLLSEVEILEEELSDVIVVSQDIVQREISGRSFVFVAAPGKEDGTTEAKKAYVETGAQFNNQVVILAGLKAGDQIIQTGSRGLVDGQLITLEATATPSSTNVTTPANNGK